MEDLFFNDLCSKIPETKLSKLIKATISNDKRKFCEYYGPRVQKEFPGFRNIKSVPLPQLCSKIKNDCSKNLLVAQSLLSAWYILNTKRVNTVKSQLDLLNYSCIDPDFKTTSLQYDYLKLEHSLDTSGLSYSKIFDYNIDEDELFDITLICILLGWYPSTNTAEDKNETSENRTLNSNEDKEISLNELIEKLNVDYDHYLEIKEKFLKYLNISLHSIAEEKSLNSTEEYISMHNNYSLYRESIIKTTISIESLFENIQPSLPDELSIKFKLKTEDESVNVIVDSVNTYVKNIFEYQTKLIDNSQICITDLLSKFDRETRAIFEDRVTIIKNKYLPNLSLEQSHQAIKEFQEIEDYLKEEINSYDLNKALLELKNGSSKRAENFILNYINQNGNAVDRLIFFVFLLPSHITLSLETSTNLLTDYIEFLSKLKKEELSEYLNMDHIYRIFQESDEGKAFIALSAIVLFLIGKKEIASSLIYTEGVYDSLRSHKGINNISEKVLLSIGFNFYDSKKEELILKKEELESIFQRQDKYHEMVSGIEIKYKLILENKILPELHSTFIKIQKESDTSISQNIIYKISEANYANELYNKHKSDLIKNVAIERKIVRFLDKIITSIVEYFNILKYEKDFPDEKFIPYNGIELDFQKFFGSNLHIKPLEQITINILNDYKNETDSLTAEIKHKTENVIVSEILKSKFLIGYCTELLVLINQRDLKHNEMILCLWDNLKDHSNREIFIQKLLESQSYDNLLLLENEVRDLDFDKVRKSKSDLILELKKIEEYISSNGHTMPIGYDLYKSQGRFKFCKNLLLERREKITEEKKKSSEKLASSFDNLQLRSAQIRLELIAEKSNFSELANNQIHVALSIVDEVSHQKKENQIELAEMLLKEIDHLKQFKNESLDQLNRTIKQYSEESVKLDFNDLFYLNIPLIEIVRHINHDDHLSLGLTSFQWKEISSDRKEYILDLIGNWMLVADKPSTKEDIHKNKLSLDTLEQNFRELLINLFSICSIYKTNDSKRIGQDPLQDWNYSTDLPFMYTSKLQSPRCSSLDRPIHFYILTKTQTSSKKYIIRLRDFISEKQYDQTGFNVIVLLDDKEKFNKLNTYSVTKNLPILDEIALKSIIFSVAEQKLPKWKFVSLLTLNSKISTIQPFKTQGSVDSNSGIFVGRSDIIKQIINGQKDFAIYGGRKIGKSSLLSVVSANLSKNGHIISLQSFQGIDNPLTIAKSIIEDLKNAGLKSNSLLTIENLDDFSNNLFSLYRENDSEKVVIILDEMDELIHKEKKTGRHQIIEIFRNISHKTNHQWRFIFAGFKEMYLEIHGKGVYEHWTNPWQNFVEDSNMQLSEIESPRELIDEGLKDILGLDYDKEVIDLITNYSTGHPAFLQKFCECLVKSIDNRISPENRRIFKKDVLDVFEKDTEFVRFVKSTLDLNLSIIQELITVVAAMDGKETFTEEWVSSKIREWIDLFEFDIKLDESKLEVELELLTITGIVKETSRRNEFRFTHPHYIVIIKRLDKIDKNLVENLLVKLRDINEN